MLLSKLMETSISVEISCLLTPLALGCFYL